MGTLFFLCQTGEKRTQQMIDILGQGYKSIDLYRQKGK